MIAVLQRVNEASIAVDGNEISRIDNGLLILLGVIDSDSEEDCNYLIVFFNTKCNQGEYQSICP